MSKAIKCDCCGQCFDPLECKAPFASAENVRTVTASSAAVHQSHENYGDLDFCPECTKKLLKLFHEGYSQ